MAWYKINAMNTVYERHQMKKWMTPAPVYDVYCIRHLHKQMHKFNGTSSDVISEILISN